MDNIIFLKYSLQPLVIKPSNYTSISFTCIASKQMDHASVSNIMSFYDEHIILSPHQHGFRSKRSC